MHAGVAANDRMLYPAYEACQAAGVPVVVHCGTSTFAGSANAYADPVLLDRIDGLPDILMAHPAGFRADVCGRGCERRGRGRCCRRYRLRRCRLGRARQCCRE